jgi:lysophospholipase L1-like esterase
MVLVTAAELLYAISRERLPNPDYEVDVRAGADLPGDEFTVAIFGDSTVAGVGADSAEQTLGGYVAQQLSRELGRPVRVVGSGVSGARTRDVLGQLKRYRGASPDAVIIEIGSNDATHWTGLDTVERHTRAVLEHSQSMSDIVVLGSAGKLNTPNFLPPLRQLMMARATSVRRVH